MYAAISASMQSIAAFDDEHTWFAFEKAGYGFS
jgi:hypothetical protein